jgi:demethylmenaquinone methyltransferase/2-methoxy-6-polyprenyl-1,4-benzoquinol methylase
MNNPFYVPGAQRAGKVRELFGAIAWRYDFLNDLQSLGLHRLWKRRLARLARLGPGQRALDVCCGTGDVALALVRTGARVTGLDFSPEMLAVARRRARTATAAVEFIQGDALALPFADASFDAVTISYGLRNLADFRAGLAEMARVLRPGGRLVVLDFGKPASGLWRTLYFAYLRRVVPAFGRVFAGRAEAYAYILESLRHYPDQAGVAALLGEVGLGRVEVVNLLGGAMAIHVAEKGASARDGTDESDCTSSRARGPTASHPPAELRGTRPGPPK